MPRGQIAPLLLTLTWLGCRTTAPVSVEELYGAGMRFGTERTEIRANLGDPRSVDVSTGENRHVRGAVDSLFTWRYDGLTFHLNRPGPIERDLLTETELDGTDVRLPGGIRVGTTTVSYATDRLGPPDESWTAGDTIRNDYAVPGGGAEDRVSLIFVQGTLRRVRWTPYVD